MTEGIPLGAFEALRTIGSGGQGTVWRAVHPPTGTALAIKVLATLRASEPSARAAFRREVRASAGLDHPNIIVVLDQGVVTPEAEAASGRRLAAGSPWLAMELARTSLADLPGARPWEESRALLAALLRALAHAHARGVVHRDLKPANVLFPGAPRGAPAMARARLADFGLASGVHDVDSKRRASGGTPLYMAPEQFRADLVDQGPWTDLYALGWMAWELVAGANPLIGIEIAEIRALKTTGALPPWPDDAAAPVGFDQWVHRLLQLDPRQRYACAADALATLTALPDEAPPPPERPLISRPLRPASSTTIDFAGRAAPPSSERTWVEELPTAELMPVHLDLLVPDVEPAIRVAAPIPARWSDALAERPPALQGAGLGLFGLRTPPLVGRDAEREALWAALTATAEPGPPRVLLLRGNAGVGKTRLGAWLAEQAQSQAGAEVLRVSGESSGAHGCLGAMLRDHFATDVLDEDQAAQRVLRSLNVRGLLDPVDQTPLLQLAGVEVAGPTASRSERFASLNALIRALSADRSVVVFLDEATHAPEALRWLAGLRHVTGLRVLVVLTARDEDLAEDADGRALIEALGPDTLSVPKLPGDAQRELIRSLLRLDEDLLATLTARTNGNPDFNVRLLTDWVSRGLLVAEPAGLRLRPGARLTLPDSLHAAWAEQVDRVATSVAPDAGHMLEIAAVIGMNVDLAVWRAACGRAGYAGTDALLEALLDAALARPALDDGRSWRFAHGMVRESLLRRAQESGTRRAHHATVATVLVERDARPGDIGLHLARAGAPAEALPLLLRGLEAALELDDLSHARRLGEEARRAIARLALPPTDPSQLRLGLLQARIMISAGRFSEAEAYAAPVQEAAAARGVDDLAMEALRLLTLAALGRVDIAVARPRADALAALAASLGDESVLLRAHIAQAQVAMYAGELDPAEDHWQAAHDRLDLASPDQAALIRFGVTQIAVLRGDYVEAERLAGASAEALERLGMRRRLAQALNTWGDALRKSGDPVGAVTAYRRAEHLLEAMGAVHATVVRINLGLTLLAAESFDEAGATLRRTLGEVRAQGHAAYEYAVRHALLAVTAAARDREAFAAHLAGLEAVREHGHFVDADLASVAEQAGDLWYRAWDAERAGAAWSLAEAQWRDLGKPEDAARTRRKLHRPRSPLNR